MSLTHEHEAPVNDERAVLKGLAARMIGGLIASWVMDQFQRVWIKASEALPNSDANISNESSSPAQNEVQEPATILAAKAVSENIFGHELKENEKKVGGNLVHYTVGSTSGAIYGAAAELTPKTTAGAGIPFGTALWLVVDEGAVPLLGLSKGPAEYPPSTHIYALASHFVFGLTTEMIRRALRRSILR